MPFCTKSYVSDAPVDQQDTSQKTFHTHTQKAPLCERNPTHASMPESPFPPKPNREECCDFERKQQKMKHSGSTYLTYRLPGPLDRISAVG